MPRKILSSEIACSYFLGANVVFNIWNSKKSSPPSGETKSSSKKYGCKS